MTTATLPSSLSDDAVLDKARLDAMDDRMDGRVLEGVLDEDRTEMDRKCPLQINCEADLI